METLTPGVKAGMASSNIDPGEREGDEVPPDTDNAGVNICPDCGGSGTNEKGDECASCDGTGEVIEAVGGG